MRSVFVLLFLMSPFVRAEGLYQVDNFFITDSPSPENLKKFKAAGGEVVVDLREFEEKSKECGEVITATKLGLKYTTAPMPKAAPFTKESVKQVEDMVAQSPKGKPVFVYCSSGQRAAGWLAIHKAKVDKVPMAEALATAKTAGLKNEHVVEAVKDYLSAN